MLFERVNTEDMEEDMEEDIQCKECDILSETHKRTKKQKLSHVCRCDKAFAK